ncbi:hypothetical protein [Hyphococcus sp.]|uniref:hypothetical protein n=1 Tax=Hyphococcus sp. TaxID=2038636 RepID=UPI00207ED1A5|nr:MAG: hypothetical protein DHS20C04_07260 [Marinicaulis sp.]
MRSILLAALFALSACADENSAPVAPADAFMANIAKHCGKSYAGRVVSNDAADADFAKEALVMQVRECSDDELRIPFHVGDDHSRTWVVSRTEEGLRLKHDHRHEDGSEDAVTQYGGDSGMVTPARAEFPVDPFSIELFQREGLTASVTNVWAMETTGAMFAYELSRENRFFRVEFDLTEPVAAPPAPWGAIE